MRLRSRLALAALPALSLTVSLASSAIAATPPVRTLGDGAWSWFADPRAVRYDGARQQTYVGWVARDGDIKVSAFDHVSLQRTTARLESKLQVDDHSNPALQVLPDGRLRVFYSAHNGRSLFYRTSTRPEDVTAWDPREKLPTNTPGGFGSTYPNPVHLSGERRSYLFWRGGNYNPTFASQADGADTWSPAATLVSVPGERPYAKYETNGTDSIDVAFTNAHPQEAPDVNVYYARYRAGGLYRADGARIGTLGQPITPAQADLVYDGAANAWVHDIALDAAGRPVIVLATFPSPSDHRYRYARWTGSAWVSSEITPAGGSISLDGQQPYYSGGVTLDHEDPSVVYLSRDVGGTFEVETWRTPDGGATWTRTPVTAGSSSANVRPVSPRGLIPFSGDFSVVWLHGTYTSYVDYRTSLATAMATGGNQPPIADAEPSRTAGRAPLTVSFDGSGATDPDGTVIDWSWNFGDGTALGSGPRPSHTYTSAGHYFATLTVTDDAGARDAFATEVVVQSANAYRDDVLATPGLVAYWRLGEAGGTTAADAGARYPGKYAGAVVLARPGALVNDGNTSAAFDGTSAEMTAATSVFATAGTLEGWFDWRGGVAVMRDHTSGGGWILAYAGAGTLWYRAGGTSFNTGQPLTLVQNGWHHLALTKNGAAVTLYLDGQPLHSAGGAGSAAAAMPWHVMRNGTYAQYAQGGADEVAVYSVALDGATIARHYRLGAGL